MRANPVDLHHLLVHVDDGEGGVDRHQSVHRRLDQAPAVVLGLAQVRFEFFLFGDVPRRGEDPLERPVGPAECIGIEGDLGLLPGGRLQREFVVREAVLLQDAPDGLVGPFGVGKIIPERNADQPVARDPRVRTSICRLTSVTIPTASVVSSASTLDSINPRL